MKRLLLGMIFLTSSHYLLAQSKSVESLYQKHKSNPDFFHLDLGGSFMNFAKSLDVKLDNGHAESISNSMERLKMFKLPVNGEQANSEFNSLKKSLEKEKFDLMMEASEKNSSFMVYTKGSKRISDVVVLVKDKSEDFLVIELQGDFDSETLAEVGNNIK
ncbi:DUF4252 domain-containing protein [Shivajiella indica]|uniref:DUF4252 domain-containing protein n=1 Tax=Shivajiella indica TaxID=872115 RepID=A0ABW5B3W3_9BACT